MDAVPPALDTPQPGTIDDASTVGRLRATIVAKLTYQVGKSPAAASERDWFVATAIAVRDDIKRLSRPLNNI